MVICSSISWRSTRSVRKHINMADEGGRKVQRPTTDSSPFVTANTTTVSFNQRVTEQSPIERNDDDFRVSGNISTGISDSRVDANVEETQRRKEHRRRRRRWQDQIRPSSVFFVRPSSSLAFFVVALAALYIPVAPVVGIRQSMKPHYPIERAIGEYTNHKEYHLSILSCIH